MKKITITMWWYQKIYTSFKSTLNQTSFWATTSVFAKKNDKIYKNPNAQCFGILLKHFKKPVERLKARF